MTRAEPVAGSDEARRIHERALVIDTHNDLSNRLRLRAGGSVEGLDRTRPELDLHTDIPRLRAGGVGAQFFAAFVPPLAVKDGHAVRHALEQIDVIHRMIRAYPNDFAPARSAADIERIRASGRIASLVAVENGQAIDGSLGVLRTFRELGAAYLTLTHVDSHEWCDASTDEPRHGGLSAFGESIIAEMNRIGMMVDVAHVSDDAVRHVLRVSRAPVIASHSGATAVCRHPRNLSDELIRGIADRGGAVMVNFYSGFIHDAGAEATARALAHYRQLVGAGTLSDAIEAQMEAWFREHPVPPGTVADVVNHIDHVAKVAGVDHVGLGSDFDGISNTPNGLKDVSGYPAITAELLGRGYCEEDVIKILGANVLSVMRAVEAASETP